MGYTENALNIVSLNVKGLNTPEKRRMLLHDMRRLKADVIFLQEKHFRNNCLPILKNRFYPVVYHSKYAKAKSRGVSILFSAKLPWTCIDTKTDGEGRYLFLRGRIGDVEESLANLYAPNERQGVFLKRHITQLLQYSVGQLMVAGDLNILLTPTEDTSTGSSSSSRDLHKRISSLLHSAKLIDTWRLFNPGERDYTFYSRPHQSYSQIDYFLIPHRHLHAVRDTAIGSITWTDHAPITLRYALSDAQMAQRPPWRLNEGLLQNPEVMADVVKEIGHYFDTNKSPDSDMGVIWKAHKAVIRGYLLNMALDSNE